MTTGRKMKAIQTLENFVIIKIIVIVSVVSIPTVFTANLFVQPFGLVLTQCTIIPSCDKVNGINTPTAYSGIRLSVFPWNAVTSTADKTPRKIIPLEKPRRSPRTINACGRYLSLANINARSGNAE
ncbi:hypothetical protein D3C73_1090590 [compost metagenome]